MHLWRGIAVTNSTVYPVVKSKAINSYEINRSELFITTKVWIDDMGYDKTIHAFHQSLKNMHLYLIHWSVADYFIESWKALEFLYEEGLVKSIGVSNCLQHHLETIQKNCVYKPMVVQNEFHPRLIQQELVFNPPIFYADLFIF